jgi:hypothetical protein
MLYFLRLWLRRRPRRRLLLHDQDLFRLLLHDLQEAFHSLLPGIGLGLLGTSPVLSVTYPALWQENASIVAWY